MYERHFQLRERPFALSPDPEYLYPSRVHQEALGYLRYGVEGHAGFVVITGEIGSGKTTLLQSLLGSLDANTSVARIMNTMLDPRELLDAIMLDFGLDPAGMSKPVLLHKLADFLVQQRRAGRLTLLIVDEAQNLSLAALEEIRMLSNLETEKSKLVQIVMVGQPELRQKLAMRELEQLRQRITVSYHIVPLDADETCRYINHRLKRAALGTPMEFPRPVTELVHQHSGGVPRIINVIADATLLFAYGVDRKDVDVAITQEALGELEATGVLSSYKNEGQPALAAAGATALVPDDVQRLASELQARAVDLSARERELVRREREIASRQRMLDEEARRVSVSRAAEALASRTADVTAPSATQRITTRSTAASSAAVPASTVSDLRASSERQVAPAPATGTEAAAQRPITASDFAATSPRALAGSAAGVATTAAQRPLPVALREGVRIQRYDAPLAPARTGLWDRLIRALFGPPQPNTGAWRRG